MSEWGPKTTKNMDNTTVFSICPCLVVSIASPGSFWFSEHDLE